MARRNELEHDWSALPRRKHWWEGVSQGLAPPEPGPIRLPSFHARCPGSSREAATQTKDTDK